MKRNEETAFPKLGVVGSRPKELDQYFTKDAIARECVVQLESMLAGQRLQQFVRIIEPSFGGGSFLRALEPVADRLVYCDIDASDERYRRDFLTDPPPTAANGGRVLTIGNPPFGKGKAVQFFNTAAAFSEVIAFVLPRSFRKESICNRLDRRFWLVHEHILAPHSFLFQGADYDVPCVWQVWVKNTAAALFTEQLPVNEHALRPITKPVTSVDDFSFVTRDAGDFHAVIQRVGQRCGQVFLDVTRFLAKDRSTEAGSFFYIRVADASRKADILNRLVSLDLEHDETKYDTASSHHSISKSRICQRYSEGQ